MLGPREVVTLQLGHYAGSVGAHWWGLQVKKKKEGQGEEGKMTTCERPLVKRGRRGQSSFSHAPS